MKISSSLLSIVMLGFTSYSFACDIPKWCHQSPNSTNGWVAKSYQCGCADAPKFDSSPRFGQQKATPNGSVNDGGRGTKTISK